ncbi:MAG TPA: aldehyde ferredoxin oxidoreductase family protein [Vicinamibacterales bacterium]|nr:aldehyde ferredoxin oxidoreductase family protein [Vicinamibacterales bacterium]
MPFGYHGRYLLIDASTGESDHIPLSETVLRQYIGGSGLGARILLDENGVGSHFDSRNDSRPHYRIADPLSPAAPLVFAFSPLVGSPLTTSAKFAVVSRSPLTERFNDSLASSGFAISGKRVGCDAIVIVGRAPMLSVLVIDDGNVRLQAADDLRGDTCQVTEEKLRARLGSDYRIASIGPAGERQVRYATISHDGRHAGRGGSGAVLGSKNVKAIAVRGTKRVEWAHPRELTELSRDLSKRSFGPATAKYRELGTATNLLTFNRFGTLPTRNFQSGTFDEAASLSPEQLSEAHARTRASCVACTIGCEHIYSLGDRGVRLEYESLFALGSLCGVGNGDAVLRASRRCDELGLDTISTGGTIAFAMECVERGLLDEPWLTFGSGDAVMQAIEVIGRREGVGQLLAEGSRRAADEIGRGSIAFAPQVKGLEIPGYEPRGLQTMALGFAVGARGADHNRSGAYDVDFSDKVDRRHATLDSVRHAIESEDKAALMDSLILCKFLRRVLEDFHGESASMLRAVTGWDVTPDELCETARRIVAAKRQFNLLAGWTPDEDTLPERFLSTPLPNDPEAALSRERLQELVAEYHRQRGW